MAPGPFYYRKVIRVTAEDSPNVRLARIQEAAGQRPTGEVLVPGVLTWDELQEREATWDPVRKCIGLQAQFWQGPHTLLFPPLWLDECHAAHRALRGRHRQAKAVGVDPAHGGDSTCLAAVDEWGLLELVSEKTPDTSKVKDLTIAFGQKHRVPPERWVFDYGGGGYEHSCDLKRAGYAGVRAVYFGAAPTLEIRGWRPGPEKRREGRDERYAYVNLRAELYHSLSLLCDPGRREWDPDLAVFALPAYDGLTFGEPYKQLRNQLAVLPRLTDGNGRIWMLPKTRRDARDSRDCLIDLIGHSPDEVDAVVLAVYGMQQKPLKQKAGVS